jgi:hypothetical protein
MLVRVRVRGFILDVGYPGSGVEAAVRNKIDSALDSGVVHGLGQAPPDVVVGD